MVFSSPTATAISIGPGANANNTLTIGPLVGVLRAHHLPLSFFGTGQNVPADLQRVTAPVLADWVMGEMVQGAVA